MKASELPIPIHEVAFLQAYLCEVFALEGQCRQNFEKTEWHLKGIHKDEEVESIIQFFKSNGVNCDCDIIHKFDLRIFLNGNKHQNIVDL